MLRALLSFFIPGGLAFALALWYGASGHLPQWSAAELRIYPYAVLGAGLFMGWRFQRSRPIFLLLTLAACGWLLHTTQAGDPHHRALTYGIMALVPLQGILVSVYLERGLFTPLGLIRLCMALLPPLALAILLRTHGSAVEALLAHHAVAHWPTGCPPPRLLVLALLGLAVSLYRFSFRRDAMEASAFWVQLLVLVTLWRGHPGQVATFQFATAGLILLLGLVENSFSMAFRDDLTALPARRALNEALLHLGSRYTIAMVDIDHFKRLNDRYGHDTGDQVLRMVASHLARVGGGGRAFRYGGEEFAILFPGRRLAEVESHLEAMRQLLSTAAFSLRGRRRPRKKPEQPAVRRNETRRLNVTVSVGVAETLDDRKEPRDVLEAADKALYRAKRGGRNRVCT